MNLTLGKKLNIRSMVYVAGEPVPFFWPMRTFIHHNPLHGFEHLPFEAGLREGERLFRGRSFLPREKYQEYLSRGKISKEGIESSVEAFVGNQKQLAGVELKPLLLTLLTDMEHSALSVRDHASVEDVADALAGAALIRVDQTATDEQLADFLRAEFLEGQLIYESVDKLYGTEIGAELDELVVKSCLDFFDEGQSVWGMPNREKGFFVAWRELALRNARFFMRGLHIREILSQGESAEDIITYVMEELKVPRKYWPGYFSREFARLHGWSGFIRWRSNSKDYAWQKRYPADLVEYLAVRLAIALALLKSSEVRHIPVSFDAIESSIESDLHATYLRYQLASGAVIPSRAFSVEKELSRKNDERLKTFCRDYVQEKRAEEARLQAGLLQELSRCSGSEAGLDQLDADTVGGLLAILAEFEKSEGMIWLRSMEQQAITKFFKDSKPAVEVKREKRPFAQALFCIDVRSERIRRHMEAVGDYQTYGIAGFFGVPAGFLEFGKGSETHLCPVLVTPKNLVLEIAGAPAKEYGAVTTLGKAVHELKESVLTPFVTVEAIGLLFGFDMVGKTIFPAQYSQWRSHLNPDKPNTRLLIDKLDRDEADSIVRAVQRAVIVKAVEQELSVPAEKITDDAIRCLRERAMMNKDASEIDLELVLGVNSAGVEAFIERLRTVYLINRSFSQMQMERLGRIGFTVAEQAAFVNQALKSIGLTKDFSRFVLLIGHGSVSDNNPYESALDCGACGGNHGLVNARILAQMANNPEVRQRLKSQGFAIPSDCVFVPALHNTTTDGIELFDLELIPPSHFIYLDRLRSGLSGASRRSAHERLQTLQKQPVPLEPAAASRAAMRNSLDWSQVRPEWGLSGNAYFVIGRRELTQRLSLEGRAFLHSYDYRVDPNLRLLENILSGPLVVGQWINMEHYFSAVDNEHYGSGSKVYHNVAGRFGVMTGNMSDLRTGLPSQTVLNEGEPYHEPIRLITFIEAPFEHAKQAVESVASVKGLVFNEWVRLVIIDPEAGAVTVYEDGQWRKQAHIASDHYEIIEESA